MFYDALVYGSLTAFGAGLVYKISGWFRFPAGDRTRPATLSGRAGAALKGLAATLFSYRLVILIRVFLLDVLVQIRILKKDRLRWIMHMLIFTGFLFLLFTHALDRIIITPLHDRYYLRPDPFLLVPGVMVIAGLSIAAFRRFFLKVPRLKTNAMDGYALLIPAVIILSGTAMELAKLTSYHHYQTFWYVHVLTCFPGLAFLPFSKLFHALATPASLLANSVMSPESPAANIMTRQVMELDACTHCCACSLRCSVAAAGDRIGNDQILPSERMVFLKDYIAGRPVSARGLAAIGQGICLCTNCDRCTVACPSGIDLRDLWFNVRETILQRGPGIPLVLTPFSFYRGLRRRELDPEKYPLPIDRARRALTGNSRLTEPADAVIPLPAAGREFRAAATLSGRAGTFAWCFTCENCSTVCPVVGNYDRPGQHLDLLPHQIIRSLGLGLADLAMSPRMLWYCLTCYQCQEHCPQGVKVTDIFFDLKNMAAAQEVCSPEATAPAERAAREGCRS